MSKFNKVFLMFLGMLFGEFDYSFALVNNHSITGWGNSISHDENGGDVPSGFLLQSDTNNGHRLFVMAQNIAENGGAFVPVEMWCHNDGHYEATVRFMSPKGFSEVPMQWLCADGYYGQDCLKKLEGNVQVERIDVVNVLNRGVLSLDGQWNDDLRSKLHVFDDYTIWGGDAQEILVLGVVRYLKNGIVAAPVQAGCAAWDGWDAQPYFRMMPGGKRRILCAQGYAPNTQNADDSSADCVAYGSDEHKLSDAKICSDAGSESYTPAMHKLVWVETSNCYRYICSGENMAFDSLTTRKCVSCVESRRRGIDENGVCKECQNDEVFDLNTRSCKSQRLLSRQDLQFGSNKNKSTDLDEQCWTKDKYDFKTCVLGNK